MKKVPLALMLILVLGAFSYAFETDDPEMRELLDEHPELEAALDSNPEYAKVVEQDPELFKKQLKEELAEAETPEGQQEQAEAMAKQFEQLKTDLNAQADSIPGIIKWFIGKERVNIHIDSLVVGMRIYKGRIEEIKRGGLEEPTMEVSVSMKDVAEMSQQNKNMMDAFQEGKIKVKPLRFRTKVKVFIIKKVFKFAAKRMAQQ